MQVAPEHPANRNRDAGRTGQPRRAEGRPGVAVEARHAGGVGGHARGVGTDKERRSSRAQKVHDDMQLAAREAAELARVAEKRAAESAASAHRWMRIAGVAKIVLASFEAIVACPAAETGIGTVGCMHALSSYKSGWDEAWNAEPSPTAFHQAFKAAAKPFTSEKNADLIMSGNLGDAAVGMGTSWSLDVRPGAPPTVTGPARAGAGAAATASADAEAIEATLKALGVAEGEGAQLSTGVRGTGVKFSR